VGRKWKIESSKNKRKRAISWLYYYLFSAICLLLIITEKILFCQLFWVNLSTKKLFLSLATLYLFFLPFPTIHPQLST